MANDIPDSGIAADLAGPDRMLDAINQLGAVRPNTQALRTMFGVINADAKAVEATQAKLKQTLPRPKPSTPLPAPAL
jgi:hypothetical protein